MMCLRLSNELVYCQDCESYNHDCQENAVDGAAHCALEHKVEGLEVGDFAAGALLGDAVQALVAQRAVVEGSEQDVAIAGYVLNFVAAGVKESYALAVAAKLYRLLSELLSCAAAVAPLYQRLD